MQMTRKHFRAIAKLLKEHYPGVDATPTYTVPALYSWVELVRSVADMCAETNPRFDRERFITACYPDPS